jgi:hypothetical protein
MPDHNHGRTGVSDARRRGDRARRLATSNLSFHNALGFGKSPSLQSTTGSSKYSETKRLFFSAANAARSLTCTSRADSRSETISDGVSRSEPGGIPALPAPPQVRLPGA